MVAASAMTPSMTPPNTRIQLTDKQGVLSSTGLSILQQHHKVINGLTPTVSCTCTNVGNVLTLTPFNISPQVLNYYSYWSFAFVSPVTSLGTLTATVVPTTGSLPTLPVLKTHGSAVAGSGDITINLFYILYYVDTMNGGNGAFVLQ